MALLSVGQRITARTARRLTVMSFLLPLLLWSAVSYIPFIWHPLILITDPGEVDYFQAGMLMDKPDFKTDSGQCDCRAQAGAAGHSVQPDLPAAAACGVPCPVHRLHHAARDAGRRLAA